MELVIFDRFQHSMGETWPRGQLGEWSQKRWPKEGLHGGVQSFWQRGPNIYTPRIATVALTKDERTFAVLVMTTNDVHTIVCGLVVVGFSALCGWCARHIQIKYKR